MSKFAKKVSPIRSIQRGTLSIRASTSSPVSGTIISVDMSKTQTNLLTTISQAYGTSGPNILPHPVHGSLSLRLNDETTIKLIEEGDVFATQTSGANRLYVDYEVIEHN